MPLIMLFFSHLSVSSSIGMSKQQKLSSQDFTASWKLPENARKENVLLPYMFSYRANIQPKQNGETRMLNANQK